MDVDGKMYDKNSTEARRVIVSASKELRDWKTLAEPLFVNYKTAWLWVKSGAKVG